MRAALLFLATLCAAAPASAEAPESPGLWDAIWALAEGDASVALARAEEVRGVLMGFAHDLQVDEASLDLLRDVREASLEMNLGRLYQMLPEEQGTVRVIRQQGMPVGTRAYRWTLVPTGALEADDLGEFAAELAMEPAEHSFGKGQGYDLDLSVLAGTGSVGHQQLALAFEHFLARAALEGLQPAADAEVLAIEQTQQLLSSQDDLALMAALRRSFPNAFDSLGRVVLLERIGSYDGSLLTIDARLRVDAKRLEAAGYPKLSRYVRRLRNLLSFRIELADPHGHPVVTFDGASGDASARLRFVTQDGALVPRGPRGPRPEEALRPSQGQVNLVLRLSGEAHSEGIVLRLSDYEMPLRYRNQSGQATVAVDIRTEPKLELTGEGAVTSWLAELADSAFNLQAHGQVVFKAMAHGPDGQGTRARLRYVDGDRGALAASLDAVLVDNGLVRFAMRMVGRHLVPDDLVVGEAMNVIKETLGALDRDWNAHAPMLQAAAAQP